MFGSKGTIDPVRGNRERFNFFGKPGKGALKKLVQTPDITTLQTTQNITPETAAYLDTHFFQHRPDVALRIYGMYGDENICDLSFCTELAHVEHFCADCLHHATDIDAIAQINGLKSLSLGIYYNDSFDVLGAVSNGLVSLVLGETKSKKPDLAHLPRFKGLTQLILSGHEKNIDAVGRCKNLTDLTLSRISTDDIAYVTGLNKLRQLNIYLGGIRDLSALAGCTQIERLELYQVRGVDDLSFISSMTGLEVLLIQCLKQVTALPDLSKLVNLNRLVLETMKSLRDVSALKDAPALKEFLHIAAQNMQPEDYIPLFENPHVEKLRVGFGSNKRNNAFRELAAKYGKTADIF